jgi:uncharacterized protein
VHEPATSWFTSIFLPALAVLFIGLSKAGFGGGLGMLTTPLCALAFGGREAVGIVLPLLCAGDAFSLYHYWGRWERRNLRYLLPGIVVGVLLGVQLIGRMSPRQLNVAIGLIAVAFVLFQFVKEVVFRAEGVFAPNHAVGVPCGVAAGVTSTLAHGAGPVITVFLIPQRLAKEIFVGTNVLLFTWINGIKMPFFCLDRTVINLPCFVNESVINAHTLRLSATFFVLVPIGVWLGVWLNRKVSESLFTRLIYLFTLLTGLQLIFNLDLRNLW